MLNRDSYFSQIRECCDSMILVNKDGRTITVDIAKTGGINKAIENHLRGRVRHGTAPIKPDGTTPFLIIDIDIKNPDGTVDESKKSALWSTDVKILQNFFGNSFDVFMSKSGGAHVYVPLENVTSTDAWGLGDMIRKIFSTRFHVDVFPSVSSTPRTPGARVFWEYFGGVDNKKFDGTGRVLNKKDVLTLKASLTSSSKTDYSRSGQDFSLARAYGNIVKNMPYNAGKDITFDYIERTFLKAMEEELRIIHSSEIERQTLKPVMTLEGRNVYQTEVVTIHGSPGAGKTTYVIKNLPQGALYVSTEINPWVFKEIIEKFRRRDDLFFLQCHNPMRILNILDESDFDVICIDSFQYLLFRQDIGLDGNMFMRSARSILNQRNKVLFIVSHQNRRDGQGLDRIMSWSSVSHLSTKILFITGAPARLVLWNKDTFEGITLDETI